MKITYLVKVYHIYISAIIDKLTNIVYKSTTKKIGEENREFEITKI